MKARSLRALLLASSLILSVGTTAMPIMAVDIAPDTSDSGISIDADDGLIPMSEILFVYHSFTPKSPMPDSHRGL